MRPLGRQVPLDPKVALVARLRMGGNDGDEEDALPDLAPDLRIPLVAVFQAALLVKPDLGTPAAKRVTDALGCLSVLRGVA